MARMGFRPQSEPSYPRRSKSPPAGETGREADYLKQLGEHQRPVTIKLTDGEVVRGWIEYYDRNMVRVTREGAPNLFIFKHQIRYIAEDRRPEAAPRDRS